MRRSPWGTAALASFIVAGTAVVQAQAQNDDALPSYLYGDPIHVECMNRSSYVSSIPPFISTLPFSAGRMRQGLCLITNHH